MKQMYPICEGQTKARRILWGNPQNTISWAFMKELRENNKTKKVYDIDPYVEVYQFRDNLYGLFNQNCDGAGDVWEYLIVGPEKALLIDTAFGLGDLKGLVNLIAEGKPVYVVNTHHHVDHAYGNCRFDKVYCHEYGVEETLKQNGHMFDYLFDEKGNCRWLEFDRNDLPSFRKYEVVGVPDGYVFNLGEDWDVELIWTGGHAGGHAMLLDRKERIIFAGDCLCSDISGIGGGYAPNDVNWKYRNIFTYTSNLRRICARIDEIDYVFPSHFMVNLESRVLLDELEACEAILKNPEDYDYAEDHINAKDPTKKNRRLHKYIKGFSTISYNTETGVFPPEEPN